MADSIQLTRLDESYVYVNPDKIIYFKYDETESLEKNEETGGLDEVPAHTELYLDGGYCLEVLETPRQIWERLGILFQL